MHRRPFAESCILRDPPKLRNCGEAGGKPPEAAELGRQDCPDDGRFNALGGELCPLACKGNR
jgi:hypothetical protein